MTMHPLNNMSALSLLIPDVCSNNVLNDVIYDISYDNSLWKTV